MQSRTRLTKILLVLLLSVFSLPSFPVPSARAAGNATIALSLRSGSYEKQFPVAVVVDGGGDKFNAAQVTVTVSSTLAIQNLVTGDCNFSFLQTPSIANPSFAGVSLGSSSQKCTVYTMTLAPIAKGNATITLTKGSVRRFGDAVNILSSMQSGTYSLTGTVTVAPLPTVAPSQANRYSVLLTIQATDNKPVKNTAVSLKSVATKTPLQATTDQKGNVQFTNLQPSVYDALVTNYSGDHIINVTGSNHALALGITVQPKQSSLLRSIANPVILIGILLAGIVVGGGIVVGLLWLKMKKK